jgi:hypothetical protein
MYGKGVIPIGAAATGGGVAASAGLSGLWVIVAGATLVVASLAMVSLLPRLRRHHW